MVAVVAYIELVAVGVDRIDGIGAAHPCPQVALMEKFVVHIVHEFIPYAAAELVPMVVVLPRKTVEVKGYHTVLAHFIGGDTVECKLREGVPAGVLDVKHLPRLPRGVGGYLGF